MYHLNNYMYIQLQNWYIYIWQKITIICLSLFLYTVFMNIIMADTTKLLEYFLLMGKANIVQLLSLVSGTIHVNYRLILFSRLNTDVLWQRFAQFLIHQMVPENLIFIKWTFYIMMFHEVIVYKIWPNRQNFPYIKLIAIL